MDCCIRTVTESHVVRRANLLITRKATTSRQAFNGMQLLEASYSHVRTAGTSKL
jgi:hypothetical protein